jgi:hypothetical protein
MQGLKNAFGEKILQSHAGLFLNDHFHDQKFRAVIARLFTGLCSKGMVESSFSACSCVSANHWDPPGLYRTISGIPLV